MSISAVPGTPQRKIYFAGAIRGGRDDAQLYLEVIKLLEQYGIVLTEHIGDPELGSAGEDSVDRSLHERDLQWLMESEFLVAEVTLPSLGVGYEIGKATEWGKKVLCLFRPAGGHRLSAMIAGSDRVKVREYEGVSELEKVFREFFG